jgi:hypothetical protein
MPRPGAAATEAGIDHVRLSYHYLDVGDVDGYQSLLDDFVELRRPDAPPGRGRVQVADIQAALARPPGEHQLYRIIGANGAVAVMGRFVSGSGAPSGAASAPIEFADFFTLTGDGMLLGCSRYYFTPPLRGTFGALGGLRR